jgi:hypothetical protein
MVIFLKICMREDKYVTNFLSGNRKDSRPVFVSQRILLPNVFYMELQTGPFVQNPGSFFIAKLSLSSL